MERISCAAGLPQRARSSFESVHGGDAPPRLQVIGFNVCMAPKAAEITEARRLELASGASRTEAGDPFSPAPAPPAIKPAACSPRSALQQLLLTQSLSSTPPPSPPHILPACSAASPSLAPCPPAPSSPSMHQNAASTKLPHVNAPAPSAHQSDSSSGILKSLTQSGKAINADDPVYQSSFISAHHCQSLAQSYAVSPLSSRNRSAGGTVSVSVHEINEYSPLKPSTAAMEEKDAAFCDDIQTGLTDKKLCTPRPDSKANGEGCSSLPHNEEEPPSVEKNTDSSRKGVPQVSQCWLRNEKGRKNSWIEENTSKKTSLFMFVVSSPVTEAQHHLHHAQYNVCEDNGFLSSCHLCRRHLGHGKDVFMYRGDKAFCSMECRYQQIVLDERRERRHPPIIRSGASQVYQHTNYIRAISPTTGASTHQPITIGKPGFINTAAVA